MGKSRQKMIAFYSPPKSKEKSKGEKKSRRAAIREQSELRLREGGARGEDSLG